MIWLKQLLNEIRYTVKDWPGSMVFVPLIGLLWIVLVYGFDLTWKTVVLGHFVTGLVVSCSCYLVSMTRSRWVLLRYFIVSLFLGWFAFPVCLTVLLLASLSVKFRAYIIENSFRRHP